MRDSKQKRTFSRKHLSVGSTKQFHIDLQAADINATEASGVIPKLAAVLTCPQV